MQRSLVWKLIFYAAISLFAILLLVPTVTPQLPQWWSKIFPTEKIRLGLDLRGGIYLLLEVDIQKAIESYLEQISSSLQEALKERNVPVKKLEMEKSGQIVLEFSGSKDQVDRLLSEQRFSLVHELSSTTLSGGIWRVVLVPDSKQVDQIKKSSVDQALEIIRNRIDQFGVIGPEIARQATDQILVQLPGITDTERAISLIGKTALLEFKLVDEEGNLEEALKGQIPKGDVLLYQRVVEPSAGAVSKIPYLLKERTLMTGAYITNAGVAINPQFNEPYVTIQLNDAGARLFQQITSANVGKRLAIILDNNVVSAPVIEEPIAGGKAQITGRFTMDAAKDLAIALRSGALPAPVKVIEQRTVGPTLGQDSIRKGITSILISAVLVVLFMIVYYKISGVIADVALVLNIILTLAALALFRATLTLPGIAGLVLTIGMAVDANILIHERIKEELRAARTIRSAIDQGYHHAFTAIFDSHVAALISGGILYWFGTGPVKGFAVTLCIGLIANLFTAVFVTRAIHDYITLKSSAKRLSI